MKSLTKTILLLFILQAGLSSCKKQLVDKYEQSVTTETAKNTAEIKASASFKWNTTNALTFNFAGSPGDARIAVLKVTAEDGSIVYQKLQKAAENNAATIELPAHYAKLIVHFGGTSKTFDTKSGKVDMDLK